MTTFHRMLAPLRPAARALTGSTYILLGLDAVRAPGKRVELAGPVLSAIRSRVPLPGDDELLVRVNAGIQVAAGTMLALGGRRGWPPRCWPPRWCRPRWPGTRTGRSRTRRNVTSSGSSSTRTWP